MPTSYSPISARLFLPILIMLCVFGLHCHVIQESVREDVHDHLWKGRELSSHEATLLEEKLAKDPNDVLLRTQLLGFYSPSRSRPDENVLAAIREHVIWLVRNSPEAEVLGEPEAMIDHTADPEGYSEGKNVWMNQLDSDPNNVTFLGHAAMFLWFGDREIATELLERARTLDSSNPKWARRLARVHAREIYRGPPEVSRMASEKALELYEDAFELSDARDRESLLEDLAKVAFEAGQHDKARKYAESLLQDAQRGRSHGNRVHHGNLILGRLALAEGNAKAARFRLIAAGNIPSEPNLSTFGPNMTLAKELLEQGERDIVLRYFRLCSRFWEMDRGKLEEWTAQVEEGRIPDFGANLRY